jgi:hypothetical protein
MNIMLVKVHVLVHHMHSHVQSVHLNAALALEGMDFHTNLEMKKQNLHYNDACLMHPKSGREDLKIWTCGGSHAYRACM